MTLQVVNPIDVTEAVLTASSIPEIDTSQGEVAWEDESHKELSYEIQGGGDYIDGNGFIATNYGEFFTVSMTNAKQCVVRKFNSSFSQVGELSFFSDSGEPDVDMRVCGSGILGDDLLVYWQITNQSNSNYPRVYGQLIEGAASNWTTPPSISPLTTSLPNTPNEIASSSKLVITRSTNNEYAGYLKTVGILKSPHVAKLNNDGSLVSEVEFSGRTNVSGINAAEDGGLVVSFYTASSTETTEVLELSSSLSKTKEAKLSKGDGTAIGQNRYATKYNGDYYLGVMLNTTGVNSVNVYPYYSDFVNKGAWKEGEQVVYTPNKTIYQCLVDYTFSNPSETATGDAAAEWIEVSPSNKWRAFDGLLNTKTKAETEITMTLNPVLFNNALGFLGFTGVSSIRIEVLDSGSSVIYDKTYTTGDFSAIYDYYSYLFYQVVSLERLVVTDLPQQPNVTINITISGSSIEIGQIVTGATLDIGELVAENTKSDRFSYREQQYNEFGYPVGAAPVAVELNTYDVLVSKSVNPAIQKLLTKLDNKNSLWVGDIGGGQELITYGYFERSPIPFTMPNDINYQITVRASV